MPEGYDATQSYPLVMATHGAGERGNNYNNLRSHRLATSWADPKNQAKNPAFVFAPQVPSGLRWTTDADPDQTDYINVQLATLDALAAIEAEFNIDPDRIYVVGLSLGGHAAWGLPLARPRPLRRRRAHVRPRLHVAGRRPDRPADLGVHRRNRRRRSGLADAPA